jgi:hypothetical protein
VNSYCTDNPSTPGCPTADPLPSPHATTRAPWRRTTPVS